MVWWLIRVGAANEIYWTTEHYPGINVIRFTHNDIYNCVKFTQKIEEELLRITFDKLKHYADLYKILSPQKPFKVKIDSDQIQQMVHNMPFHEDGITQRVLEFTALEKNLLTMRKS